MLTYQNRHDGTIWHLNFISAGPSLNFSNYGRGLGMRGIRKCTTIIYRLKNTVIPVYRGISWHHQL